MKKILLIFCALLFSIFLMFGCTNQENTNCIYNEETCAEFITDCQECKVNNFDLGYFIKWDNISECNQLGFSNIRETTLKRTEDGRLELNASITLNCGNEELVGVYNIYEDTIDIFLYKKETGNLVAECICTHDYSTKIDYIDKQLIDKENIEFEYILSNYNIYYEDELIDSGNI